MVKLKDVYPLYLNNEAKQPNGVGNGNGNGLAIPQRS